MATDIAFALGVVALLGSRVHPRLKLFLLALAIVDDIGAITVIAIFYTDDLSLGWLPVAGLGLVAVVVLQRLRVWSLTPYLAIGLVVWYATFESGVHATIAGVLLGLLTPARPLLSVEEATEMVPDLSGGIDVSNASQVSFVAKESVSVADRLEYVLHPWSSFLIIPVFALANAGIELSSEALSEAATSPVTIGVVLGLVVGKPVGIVLFTWVATLFGLRLPRGMDWPQFIGMGIAAGIGFTVSIFIAGLAFGDEVLRDDAKIGILVGSAAAAVLGLAVLRTFCRGPIVSEEELSEQVNADLADAPAQGEHPSVGSPARG
jgi:NhaA family Na+:H+ antiporter